MARSCVTDPRWRELVALYRYDWIAAADVLFGKTPTWQQDLIIESVQEQGSKTSVSSGHGTGKSDMTSIMIMLFIIMYPGARAIIVANKIQQVMTGIFKYIKINWATATSRFPWLADYFVLTETAFYEVTGKGVWTVVPKGFRLGSEEALAGEHADHLLYIIDEASGVSDRAFGIITGALTGQDNRILLLSQPTRPSVYFYDTHHKLAKRPGNPDGVYTAITLNSEESPLVTPAFIKMKLAEYGGRDNPMYMIKVRGLFPKSQDGFLLGRDEVERATRRKVKIAKGWGWLACVDVAGGTGRDKSVINIMMVSGQRNKRRVINYRMLEYTDVTETQLAAKIFAECNPERFPNITIAIDGDGLGKATADLMYEYYGITVQRIRWGKKMHSREDKSLYFDKRAYANVQAAEAVKSGRMRLDKGNETIEEASKIPVGINSAGQWKVMSKEDMKKKLNLHSPDHWDTDQAWAFFEKLEDSYFRQKEQQPVAIPQTLPEALRLAAELAEQKQLLEQKAHQLNQQLVAAASKVDFADRVSVAKGILIGNFAKVVGLKQNALFAWLRENGILIASGGRKNVPFQQYINAGYFTVKEVVLDDEDGYQIRLTPQLTGKGQQWLTRKLLDAGLLKPVAAE